MNPTLLKKADLIKCYNAITGTNVSDELTREEMEEHLLWLRKTMPIETHIAMQAALSDDPQTLARVLVDIDKEAARVARVARESSGIIIKDNSRFGELIIEKPVVKSPVKTYGYGGRVPEDNDKFKIVDSGPNWVLISRYGNHTIRLIDHKGDVVERYMKSYVEAMAFIRTIPEPTPEPIYEEDFVTLETGFKWIY